MGHKRHALRDSIVILAALVALAGHPAIDCEDSASLRTPVVIPASFIRPDPSGTLAEWLDKLREMNEHRQDDREAEEKEADELETDVGVAVARLRHGTRVD